MYTTHTTATHRRENSTLLRNPAPFQLTCTEKQKNYSKNSNRRSVLHSTSRRSACVPPRPSRSAPSVQNALSLHSPPRLTALSRRLFQAPPSPTVLQCPVQDVTLTPRFLCVTTPFKSVALQHRRPTHHAVAPDFRRPCTTSIAHFLAPKLFLPGARCTLRTSAGFRAYASATPPRNPASWDCHHQSAASCDSVLSVSHTRLYATRLFRTAFFVCVRLTTKKLQILEPPLSGVIDHPSAPCTVVAQSRHASPELPFGTSRCTPKPI